MICKECNNPATLKEYYPDTGNVKRLVCSGHAFSFDPDSSFAPINRIEQSLYDKIISLIPIVCVDAAIVYDNKILLIKRRDEPAKGEWWLPGGRLYKSETLESCALRKADEEVGLFCTAGPMIHYASTDFGTVHSVNFCYLLFASDDKVKLDDTCLDYMWISSDISDIDAKWFRRLCFIRPYIRQCMSKAFDYLQVASLEKCLE